MDESSGMQYLSFSLLAAALAGCAGMTESQRRAAS
jgi:hypothetical protein